MGNNGKFISWKVKSQLLMTLSDLTLFPAWQTLWCHLRASIATSHTASKQNALHKRKPAARLSATFTVIQLSWTKCGLCGVYVDIHRAQLLELIPLCMAFWLMQIDGVALASMCLCLNMQHACIQNSSFTLE